ncbi:rhodanese-like domain protein [Paenibacillus pini JCM 16418]|uniref:Rhodanese-like domain protein n=2 Tax=Paenibacillus TaxID=44249 RepID=W7Y9L3_9BACL|nr:rhodanese-like domain protein [Paenibacillus pini JCM 16418]
MPIVRTKKAIGTLAAGQVLELQATDKGSLADIKAWANSTGHQYLGSVEDEENNDKLYKHYIRKSEDLDVKEEAIFPHTIQNSKLELQLNDSTHLNIIDVREPAEYVFGHIPGSKSIPLAELEDRVQELDKEQELFIVCRTGHRSNTAANLLTEKGFINIKNVVPGMSEWTGTVNKNE